MTGLLSNIWRLLLIPAFALAFFLGAYFYFYQAGGYDAPSSPDIPLEDIVPPSSSMGSFQEEPLIQEGVLLVDTGHGNSFTTEEVSALLSRVADRGYDVEFNRFGVPQLLEEKLRKADSLAVIVPARPYSEEEVDVIGRFVKKGWTPDSPPDMVGSCLVCFQGVSGCRPGVTHDMIGHRTGSRVPSLRVSAAVRCQLWLFSVRRRHGPAWQLGRVAYKPMLQAGSLCSIRLGSQRQYPLPRPEQQLV